MEVTQGELQQHRRGETRPSFCHSRFCWLAGILNNPVPPSMPPSPLKLVFMVYCGHYIIEALPVVQNDERGERGSVRGG